MLLVCFVVVNAAIRFAAVPDASVIHGYDAGSYLSPAKGMLAYGDYVRTEIPSVADTFTVPLYPALLAVNIFLFGEDAGLAAVIFLQLVALYATGLMTRCLVRPFYPKAAVFAQAIVVFNPNSLSTAHLIQTETVFTLLLTAAIFFLFRFGRTLELRPALISAVFVGLAAYCRPVGLYLGAVLPFACAIFGLGQAGNLFPWRRIARAALVGAAAMTLVAAMAAPWVYRNYVAEGVPVFTSNLGPYLRDNLIQIYVKRHKISGIEAADLFELRLSSYMESALDAGYEDLSEVEHRSIIGAFALREIASQPLSAVLSAAVRSELLLFGAGAAGNFKNIFGLSGEAMHVIEYRRATGGPWSSIRQFLAAAPLPYLVLVVFTAGWATILRLFGLIGLIGMLMGPHWRHALVIVTIIGYFTATYLFLGQSRFRVPLEPLLAVLAVAGLSLLRTGRRRS